MTDKEYLAEKKRIMKLLDKWKHILGLGAHKLNIEWVRGTRQDESDVAVHCSNSWQYRLITLWVYLPVTAEHDDIEAEHIIVHELSHSLLAPLAQHTNDIDDIHEFTTECVAQAILWAYEAGGAILKVDKKTQKRG